MRSIFKTYEEYLAAYHGRTQPLTKEEWTSQHTVVTNLRCTSCGISLSPTLKEYQDPNYHCPNCGYKQHIKDDYPLTKPKDPAENLITTFLGRPISYWIDLDHKFGDKSKPPKPTNLIALIGPKGSGKTTLAKQLEPHGWKITSFATPIKRMLTALLQYQGVDGDIIHRMIYDDLKEIPSVYLSGCTPRHAMQTLGTEWRDLIDKVLWLNIWNNMNNNSEDSKIIIDDLRFLHEAESIKNLGGMIIHIDRSGFNSNKDHLSENEFLKIQPDFTITNNSDPENMFKQLNYCLGIME